MRLGIHFPTTAATQSHVPARSAPHPWPFPAGPTPAPAPAPVQRGEQARAQVSIDDLVAAARLCGAI